MPHAESDARLASPGNRRRIPGFVALAYMLTWLGWSPLALRALGVWHGAAPQWLHFVGSLGPASAGFIFAAFDDRDALRDLAKQCIRAPLRSVALAVGVPAVLFGVSAVALLIAGSPVAAGAAGSSAEFPEMPIALYALANIVFYGFGEEVGWRGFLLPRLPGGPRSGRAVLTVAVVWAVWHLPLFAFSGMSSMGIAGAAGWLVSIIAGSLLTAEMYAASRSVLVVALFHGTLDIFINSPVGGALQNIMGALVTVAGFTAPIWVRWFVVRRDERRPRTG